MKGGAVTTSVTMMRIPFCPLKFRGVCSVAISLEKGEPTDRLLIGGYALVTINNPLSLKDLMGILMLATKMVTSGNARVWQRSG